MSAQGLRRLTLPEPNPTALHVSTRRYARVAIPCLDLEPSGELAYVMQESKRAQACNFLARNWSAYRRIRPVSKHWNFQQGDQDSSHIRAVMRKMVARLRFPI
jgi:predicted HD phosphohydrolase